MECLPGADNNRAGMRKKAIKRKSDPAADLNYSPSRCQIVLVKPAEFNV
jgi:hypothetical protein